MLQREGGIAGQMREACLVTRAVLLLGRIAIRNPDLWRMSIHHFLDDTSRARIIGLMNHRVLAVEHPVIGVRPLDPYAGFIAGNDFGGAKDRLGLVRLDPE